MVDLELCFMPAVELAARIRARSLSPVELMENTLARIEQVQPALNCFCFVYPDEAMRLAREAEQAVMDGRPLGALHGLPVGVKDVTPTAGKRTTYGSRVYEHNVPAHDALIVQRLRAAGAIMAAKTTSPEFAYASRTQSPLWGVTRNPWDPGRTPGGSSGGSAAAVAAGCLPLAEGTDMGGSVRIPAAFCGLVGLKPSLGRIPMDILPTVFDNISHFGPLARNVGDANLFMNAVAGPWERDIVSLPDRPVFPVPAEPVVRGLRVALCPGLGYYALDADVERRVREAAAALADLGACVEEVRLAWDEQINEAWHRIWGVYLAAVFFGERDIDEWRARMDPNVVKLIEQGRALDAVGYKRLEFVRTRQWHELCRIFDTHDVLLCATEARVAPRHEDADDTPYARGADGLYHGLDLTEPFNNIAQCPALSVPSGFSVNGLPCAVQIIGRRFEDLAVMRVGAALEARRPWGGHRPAL